MPTEVNQIVAAPRRPWWQRLLNRFITLLLNTSLWLILWIAMLGLLFMTVYFPTRVWGMDQLSPGWNAVAEVAFRVAVSVPFGLWLLLVIHPVRMRWWLVRAPGRVWRWMRSLRQANRAALISSEASSTGAQPSQPIVEAVATPCVATSAPAAARSWLQPTTPPRPMSRRRFLVESALMGGIMADSMFIEPYSLQTVTIDIPIANLPARFAGMTIAQLSDLHINSYVTAADLERAVAQINKLQPDMVWITGDFVDWHARFAPDATLPFMKLNPREGVYSVIGNHDYYTGNIEQVKAAVRKANLGLLVNQYTTLRRGGDTLTLIGLDDPRHGRNGAPRLSMESITPGLAMLDKLTDTGPRLLMVHNPTIVPQLADAYRLDLIACGHTHGGQFQVPILTEAAIAANEYFVKGHYQIGESQVYVNRGFGFTGVPVRFLTPPELTVMRLVPA